MADISVITEGLDAIDASLQHSRDGLGHALTAMADGAAADLGRPELDQACCEFQEKWQFGLGQLGKCIDAVRGGITEVKAIYARNEATISDACGARAGQGGGR